jgi:peptidoglycan/LPS O-acetylase OafA/YrhL
MIQRIQTIYLVIAAFLLALLYSNPISEIMISDNLYLTLWHNKITSLDKEAFAQQSIWSLTILLSVILLIEAVLIFAYKKRQLQIRLCIFNILLMFGLVGLIYFYTKYTLSSLNGIKSLFLWPIVCPMIAIILNYLALKAIQKDEKLVRSYERIR